MAYLRRSRRGARRAGMRKRRGARRRWFKKAKSSLHAPKKFVCTYKYDDIVSDLSGAGINGYQRYSLDVTFGETPLAPVLSKMYAQFAITGVQVIYRPTNTSPNNTDQAATQMLIAENKGFLGASETINQILSEDNARTYTTSRGFKMYIRKPRPFLYQLGNPAGTQVISAISSARQLTWLPTNDPNALNLPHACANYVIKDLEKQTTEVKQGELWVKVYVVCKEQMLINTTPNVDASGNVVLKV